VNHFIALTEAATAYVEARSIQDAAEHLHRIRLLARAPDSVIREAAAEWSRATAEASSNYHELARCAEVASAAVKAHHCRIEELRRQFERDCE